jgi:hypothetical protein
MSQPPGQFDGSYGQPGASEPPPYGPPVGPAGYGAPAQRKTALPWLIVGAAVLLSGLGLLLVLLFTSDGDPTPTAAAPSTESTSAPAAVDAASLGRYAGSADVARAWVQAMAEGDFEAAFAGSCPQVQQAAVDADNGSGPAWTLGTYFFEQTLGGVGFTEGSFDRLVHDAVSASDVATFTLHLDSGEDFVLLVYVGADLTVCDFR